MLSWCNKNCLLTIIIIIISHRSLNKQSKHWEREHILPNSLALPFSTEKVFIDPNTLSDLWIYPIYILWFMDISIWKYMYIYICKHHHIYIYIYIIYHIITYICIYTILCIYYNIYIYVYIHKHNCSCYVITLTFTKIILARSWGQWSKSSTACHRWDIWKRWDSSGNLGRKP
jgi:hypothetical protein